MSHNVTRCNDLVLIKSGHPRGGMVQDISSFGRMGDIVRGVPLQVGRQS